MKRIDPFEKYRNTWLEKKLICSAAAWAEKTKHSSPEPPKRPEAV